MASKNLQLRVVLDLVDKAMAPLKRINQGSQATAGSIKAARDQLQRLGDVQKTIGTFRESRAGLADTSAKLQTAQDRVRQLAAGFGIAGPPTKAMAREMARAKNEAALLGARFAAQQQQVQQLRDKLSAAGISTRNLASGSQQLRTNIAATTASLNQQTEALKRQGEQQKRIAQLQQQATRAAGVGGGMAASGMASVYAGKRAGSGLGTLLAPGAGFDAQMSKVQALARLDKQSAEYAELRAQALQLGATTMFSATQAAEGQAFLAMAGFDPKAIKGAMPGLLDMAKAGDLDLGRTADISSNILSAFGIDPNNMGGVADVLTKAFTTSNVNLEMLGNTMSYVGPVARAAGVDLETTAAMAGLLGNVGIQGEKGGTAMRAMLLRLSAPTGGAAKLLDKLGVKTKDAKGNVRNVLEVLADLSKKTEKMGSGDKLGALKTIFGEEPAAAMTELLEKSGEGKILEYLNAVRDSAGAAKQTAGTMADNMIGDIDQLKSAWEDVRISLFDANNGEIRAWTQKLTEGVQAVGQWFKENPWAAQWLVKLVVVFSVITTAVGALLIPLGLLLAKGLLVRLMLAKLAMVASGGGAFGGMASGVGRLLPLLARGALLLLRFLGPVGLVITLLWGLYSNWEAIWAAMRGAWESFSSWATGLWSEFWAGLSAAWDAIASAAGSIWQSIVSNVQAVLSGGVGAWLQALINFSPFGILWGAITSALGALGIQVPEGFRTLGGFIVDGIIGGITAKIGQLRDAVVGVAGSVAGWFKEKLGIASPSKVFTQFGGWISEGAANGIEGNQALVRNAALAMAGAALVPVATADVAAPGMGTAPVVSSGTAMAPRMPVVAAGAAGGNSYTITINPAPGADPQAIARAVAAELDRRERSASARRRSSLHDLD